MSAALKPRPEDFAIWSDLAVAAAKAAVGAPSDAQHRLNRLVSAARKNAVVPSGELTVDNPAIRLVRFCREYLGETARGRRERQDRLAELANALADQLAEAGHPIPGDADRASRTPDGPEPGSARLPYAEN